MTANMDIRVLMFKNGMTQKRLAELMKMTQPEISLMLKREMAASEKRRIKTLIQRAVDNDRKNTDFKE